MVEKTSIRCPGKPAGHSAGEATSEACSVEIDVKAKKKRPHTNRIRIVQINANLWPGHSEWLEQGVALAGHVVAGQEHKLDIEAWHNVGASRQSTGFVASGAPAVVTSATGDERHRSAGTYVAVANHVGSELLAAFGKADLSTSEAPGRLSGRWIDVPGGIDIFSAYFQDAAGWNQTNVALVRQLCVVTSTVGLWILALDSSMEPEEFYRK